ncbi:MAG: HEAT repeat domain-containing protein [Polyangiaceae bacterium]|nr:HEAT repeat domain-containing protein [Polyangiaceae bacterium]
MSSARVERRSKCTHRRQALVSYGELAIGPVLELLADNQPSARTWAARVLGRIGHPRATLRLISALADADATTRAAAAEALGRIGDVRAARALCSTALTDPAPPVRACAAYALAKTGDKDAAKSIVFALRDPDAEVRSRAAEAIAALAPTDWSVLERALFDPCDRVRRSAALSLDRIGAVAAWTRALGSPVPEARSAARAALCAVAQAGLSEAISAAAANEVPTVRAAVETLLNDVRSAKREPSPSIVSARRSARISSRLRALKELASAGTPEATAALAEVVVSDPSPQARALAASSLSRCKERWLSTPALSRALMDPAAEVATEAARALGEWHGAESRRLADLPPETMRRISDLPPETMRRISDLRRTRCAAFPASTRDDASHIGLASRVRRSTGRMDQRVTLV